MQEDKYTRKYVSFDEFCNYIQTPNEVAEWYIKNHVIWPPNEHGSNHPFRWPDDIVKYKIGNCYDHGLFMYYFCKRKNIKIKICYSYTVCDVDKEKNEYKNFFGHITTIFQKDSLWYEFDPIVPKQKRNKVISGPFKTPNDYLEYMRECLKYYCYSINIEYKPLYDVMFYTKKDEEVFDRFYNHPIKNRDIFTEKYISSGKGTFKQFKEGKEKFKPVENDNIYLAYLDYKSTFLKFVIEYGINEAKKKITSIIKNSPLNNLVNIKEGVNVTSYIETPDYVTEVEEFYMLCEKDYYHQKFIDSITEMFVLTDLYVNRQNSIYNVLEVGSATIGAKKTITQRNTVGIGATFSNFIRKILDFIQQTMEDFKEKADRLISDDVEWLNRVNAAFDNIPEDVVKTLTITCVPWHKRKTFTRLKEKDIPIKEQNLAAIIDGISNANDVKLDKMYETLFPTLHQLHKKEVKTASFIYYRDGENATEVFKAEEAVKVINAMRDYIRNYKQYTNSALDTYKAQFNKLKEIQKNIEKAKETKESFIIADRYSILEEASLYNTEFVDLLYEGVTSKEEKPEEKKDDSGSANKEEEKQKTVKDANKEKPEEKKENTGNNEEEKEDPNDVKITASKNLIKFINIVSSVKLTVVEEIENSYIKILRQIYDGLKKYNRDVDEDKKNTDYNTEVRHNKDLQSQERQKDNKNKFDERLQKVGGSKAIGIGAKYIVKKIAGFIT